MVKGGGRGLGKRGKRSKGEGGQLASKLVGGRDDVSVEHLNIHRITESSEHRNTGLYDRKHTLAEALAINIGLRKVADKAM